MKSLVAAFLAVVTPAMLAAGPIETPVKTATDPATIASPEKPGAQSILLDDLAVVRQSYGGLLTPDGRSLILQTNLSGRFNLWRVDRGGNFPVQLTRSDNIQFPEAVARDGAILFLEAPEGLEDFDIFSVPQAGGVAVNLTRTADYVEGRPRLSPDERRIAFSRRPRQASEYHVAVMDRATGMVRELTSSRESGFRWVAVGWLPDNKTIVVNRTGPGDKPGQILLLDADTGRQTALTPADPRKLWSAVDIAPDGRSLSVTFADESGPRRAAIFDIQTRKMRFVPASPWEQSAKHFSPDGRLLHVETSIDGRVVASVVNVETLEERRVPFPDGAFDTDSRYRSWSADGKLLVTFSAANAPKDYWLVDPATGEREQLTRQAIASLDPAMLPLSRIVSFPSADGTLVSGILTIPWNLKRDGSNPAIVMPHGGPAYQSADDFDLDAVALASRGYFVLRPNYRGSTGYGERFAYANRFDLGGGDLEDVLAAARFLARTGYVDPARIGITGHSYGGFLTLMAIGKKPDVFAAAVNMNGIMNWFTMWEASSGGLREAQRFLVGDPVKDKAAYERMSPFTYFGAVKAPLLNLQGANDVRVPRTQAEEADRTIKKNGGIVETVIYPGEGHAFESIETQMDVRRRMVDWFDRHLKRAAAP